MKRIFLTITLAFIAALFMSCASKPKEEDFYDPDAPAYANLKTNLFSDGDVSESVSDIRLSDGKWQRVQTTKLFFADDGEEYTEEIYATYNVKGNKCECIERINLNKFTYSDEKIAELKEKSKEEIIESKALLNATDIYFKKNTLIFYSAADDYALRLNRIQNPIKVSGKKVSVMTNSSRTKFRARWTSKYDEDRKYIVYYKKE